MFEEILLRRRLDFNTDCYMPMTLGFLCWFQHTYISGQGCSYSLLGFPDIRSFFEVSKIECVGMLAPGNQTGPLCGKMLRRRRLDFNMGCYRSTTVGVLCCIDVNLTSCLAKVVHILKLGLQVSIISVYYISLWTFQN